jgi:hypothetical protein
MLERGRHAHAVHAAHVGAGELGHRPRIGAEGAVADGAVAAGQVDHRREADVDAAGADLAGHQPCMLFGAPERILSIARVVRVENRPAAAAR